jgi:hypothetical protein
MQEFVILLDQTPFLEQVEWVKSPLTWLAAATQRMHA